MACVDNLFLLTAGFSQISSALTLYMGDLTNPLVAYVTVIVWPLVHITQLWTVWITVMVAFNRYIAICRPFQAARLCTMKQARMQVIALGAVTLLYNVPRFFEFRIETERVDDDGSVVLVGSPTELKKSSEYNIVYENVFYCFFVFAGPLVILVVLNACLIRELWLARRRLAERRLPASMTGEARESQNLTLVMIVIVLIFLVCQAPAFVNQLLYYIMGDEGYDCGRVYFYYYHVSNILVSANSAANFIVYCLFRQQFRQRLAAFCGGGGSVRRGDTEYRRSTKSFSVNHTRSYSINNTYQLQTYSGEKTACKQDNCITVNSNFKQETVTTS